MPFDDGDVTRMMKTQNQDYINYLISIRCGDSKQLKVIWIASDTWFYHVLSPVCPAHCVKLQVHKRIFCFFSLKFVMLGESSYQCTSYQVVKTNEEYA